jgi:hypothetical protein
MRAAPLPRPLLILAACAATTVSVGTDAVACSPSPDPMIEEGHGQTNRRCQSKVKEHNAAWAAVCDRPRRRSIGEGLADTHSPKGRVHHDTYPSQHGDRELNNAILHLKSGLQYIHSHRSTMKSDVWSVITAAQLRAARALAGLDQRQIAELAGLSVPTIQRMEASEGVIRGNVDSLMKLIGALDAAGIELIAEGGVSRGGGRGVRLKR